MSLSALRDELDATVQDMVAANSVCSRAFQKGPAAAGMFCELFALASDEWDEHDRAHTSSPDAACPFCPGYFAWFGEAS